MSTTALPVTQPAPTMEELMEWEAAKRALAAAKEREHFLRMRCFRGLFPNPVEGTNTYVLPSSWQVKGKYVISRTVDIAVFDTFRQVNPETQKTALQLNSISDNIVNWKPDLNVKVYKQLTKEQRQFFDNALVIKEGSPALEIVEPAKRGQKASSTPEGPQA